MTRLKTDIKWFDELLPEGIIIPSSTLISGPGGTGKPLVEFALVAAWVKMGGSLIGLPLQYPSGEWVKKAVYKLYGLDLDDYRGKVVYIDFDPLSDTVEQTGDYTLKANVLRPELWDKTIEGAETILQTKSSDNMVFGSALNLLLFSRTYKNIMLDKLKDLLRHDKSRTYIFAVSTSALSQEIKILEDAADNLMFTRMEKPMKLFLKIVRMKDVEFSSMETGVPIAEELLREINEIAEKTRKTRIPEIRKI